MTKPEGAVRLRVVPLTLARANELVTRLHRHHKKVTGHRFSIGVVDEHGGYRGAAIVGRPVARGVDPYHVAEVVRLVTDGTPNACSMLYAAAARAAKAMGFWWIQTYILDSEPGSSLRGAGWELERWVKGRSWDCVTRPRTDNHPTVDKQCWVLNLNEPQTEEAC